MNGLTITLIWFVRILCGEARKPWREGGGK